MGWKVQVDGRTCILVMKEPKTFITAPVHMVVINLVCLLQKSTVIVIY